MVIVVLTYCLPQLQHHAPGVLAVVSLALRSLLRADLQILWDESCSSSWPLNQDNQGGLPLLPLSQPLLAHWKGTLKPALPTEEGPSVKSGFSSEHSAANWHASGRKTWQATKRYFVVPFIISRFSCKDTIILLPLVLLFPYRFWVYTLVGRECHIFFLLFSLGC